MSMTIDAFVLTTGKEFALEQSVKTVRMLADRIFLVKLTPRAEIPDVVMPHIHKVIEVPKKSDRIPVAKQIRDQALKMSNADWIILQPGSFVWDGSYSGGRDFAFIKLHTAGVLQPTIIRVFPTQRGWRKDKRLHETRLIVRRGFAKTDKNGKFTGPRGQDLRPCVQQLERVYVYDYSEADSPKLLKYLREAEIIPAAMPGNAHTLPEILDHPFKDIDPPIGGSHRVDRKEPAAREEHRSARARS